MSSYFGVTSATDSNYFSTMLGTSSSSSKTSSTSDTSTISSLLSGSSSSLGDYALIQSGSYKKLLTAYYKKNNESATSETTKTEKINLSSANSDATALNSSVTGLMNISVSEDNREELKNNLKTVIEKYNNLIDSASKVDNTSVLRQALWMTQGTSAVSVSLSDIGVTIGEGNKLVLNEEKFDKAELSTMKTLFEGRNSYMGKLANRTGLITNASKNAISSVGASTGYNAHADYSNETSTGDIIDSLT